MAKKRAETPQKNRGSKNKLSNMKAKIDARQNADIEKLAKKAKIDISDPNWRTRYKVVTEYIEPVEVKKGNVGRPASYKPKFCKEMIEFFSKGKRKIDRLIDTETGEVIADYGSSISAFPTFEGFSVKIGTHPKTLIDWAKKYPEFGEAYSKAKAIQKEILIDGTMRDGYNSYFSKFVAVNLTDMRDVSKVETEDKTPKKYDLSKLPADKLKQIMDIIHTTKTEDDDGSE